MSALLIALLSTAQTSPGEAIAARLTPGEEISSGPDSPPAIGQQCTEDPTCVVVGNTHMLRWKSNGSARAFVICIHGLGLCARAYKPLARALSEGG